MTSGSKMRGDNFHVLDKALGMSGAFESSHAPLPLPCRLMRVLSPVIQVSVTATPRAAIISSTSRKLTPKRKYSHTQREMISFENR